MGEKYNFLKCKSVGFLLKELRNFIGGVSCDGTYQIPKVTIIFNQEINEYVKVPEEVIREILKTKRHLLNKKEGKELRRKKAKEKI